MKKTLLAKLLFLMIVATNLAGCIIVPGPWWHEGGRGPYHDHGEYREGHGGHEGHYGHGEHH